MNANRLKAKLAAGGAGLGCSLMFPSQQLVEMLGYTGFDWPSRRSHFLSAEPITE
jgi:2-keto-3-deoxy-L-rhamnonate aldolase RhmA